MLNNEDRTAIEGLFRRIGDVERRGEPRDRDAERLIADLVAYQPAAPYYMAQTILVQEHALELAEARIKELERRVEGTDRGLGGFVGGGRAMERRGPWDRDDRRDERNGSFPDDRRGGGFLAGAAQTALGVAGGVLIGNAIASMFGAGAAQAAEAPADQPPAEQQDQGPADNADAGNDDFGGFDDGGFGDAGGFDMGGDF